MFPVSRTSVKERRFHGHGASLCRAGVANGNSLVVIVKHLQFAVVVGGFGATLIRSI
jgi:hypothetical protein